MIKKSVTLFEDPHFKADPYPFYAHLRAETPAHKTLLPNGVEVYLVTRYEQVQDGLKDPRLIKNSKTVRRQSLFGKLGLNGSSTMLRSDPPEHTRLRALAHEAFTPRYVSQLQDSIQALADKLIDAVQAQGHMDLISQFAFPLPIIVIGEMLGVPVEDIHKFRRWSGRLIDSGILSSESGHITLDLIQMLAYLRNLIARRRKTPKDDLISRLIHVEQAGDRLNKSELLATTAVLLVAGHETTVNLIGNGMLALLQDPAQLRLLQQEPRRIKGAVEELLRYVNPVQAVHRYAAEDMTIGGVPIPKGSHVVLCIAAANHDPACAASPGQLDVTHHDLKHVGFGQGIHYCLGAPLARMEGEIAFTTLLKRLPEIRLAIAPEALQWRTAFELRGLQSLPVIF